ncbi:MAG: biotin/lipoyl-binding protein, partial [Ferrovibrio sp.]
MSRYARAPAAPSVSTTAPAPHFQDGANVNAGDLLFTIDRRTYQAAYNQAQASLNTRQTEFDLAKVEYERYQRLTQTGAAAAATLDQRRQAFL